MKVLPVLDLARGEVVHAVGGDRARYRPVQSALAPSAAPLAVALAFREKLGLEDLYLADLEALGGGEPQWEVYRALLREGFRLMVDAGVRDRHLALGLREVGVESVVAGLETLEGPERVSELVEGLGPRSLVLGVDLREGSPLGDRAAWGPRDAGSIAALARSRGVRRFLVLDLARVGASRGPPLDAVRGVLARVAGSEVLVGGGVRDLADLCALAAAGVHGALAATALHRGTLDRKAIEEAGRLTPGGAPGGNE